LNERSAIFFLAFFLVGFRQCQIEPAPARVA
jgi:hypothetical protein